MSSKHGGVPLNASNMSVSLNFSNMSLAPNTTAASPGSGAATGSLDVTYKIVTTALFSIIFVTGLCGNVISVAAVMRRRHMRTSCNYFITNIALADLGVALIAAPLRIVEIFTSWPFGKQMCNLLWPLQDVFVCVSVVTHTTIALERHRAIVTPFKPRFSIHKTKLAIVGIWIGCYITGGLPIAFILKVQEHMGVSYCTVIWPSKMFRRVYITYLVLLFICAPLFIQTYAYVRVVCALRKRSLLDSPGARNQGRSHSKQITRLVRTLITILVLFQVCYLPRGALIILFEFGAPDSQSATVMEVLRYVDIVSLVLYYCKHVINPAILFGMSVEFRAAYISFIKCQAGDTSRRRSLTGSCQDTAV